VTASGTRALEILAVPAAVALSAWWVVYDAIRFQPPDARSLSEALGPLDGEEPEAARLLLGAEDALPLGKPAPGDWLAEHSEPGQTYPAFAAERPRQQRAGLRPVSVAWLGPKGPRWAADVEAAARFLGLLFQAPVRKLATVPDAGLPARPRESGQGQLHAGAALERLKPLLPKDGASLVSFTAADLYPDDSWSFVFGLASLGGRAAVLSVARLWDGARTVRLRRLLRTAGHEAGHAWGLKHCIHRRCLMNGFNSLSELDRGSLALCPICLRKLAWGGGIDVVRQNAELAEFLNAQGLGEEAALLRARSAGVRNPTGNR
jgi:archaemetzincin